MIIQYSFFICNNWMDPQKIEYADIFYSEYIHDVENSQFSSIGYMHIGDKNSKKYKNKNYIENYKNIFCQS